MEKNFKRRFLTFRKTGPTSGVVDCDDQTRDEILEGLRQQERDRAVRKLIDSAEGALEQSEEPGGADGNAI
jgi:hypothetical protein